MSLFLVQVVVPRLSGAVPLSPAKRGEPHYSPRDEASLSPQQGRL